MPTATTASGVSALLLARNRPVGVWRRCGRRAVQAAAPVCPEEEALVATVDRHWTASPTPVDRGSGPGAGPAACVRAATQVPAIHPLPSAPPDALSSAPPSCPFIQSCRLVRVGARPEHCNQAAAPVGSEGEAHLSRRHAGRHTGPPRQKVYKRGVRQAPPHRHMSEPPR